MAPDPGGRRLAQVRALTVASATASPRRGALDPMAGSRALPRRRSTISTYPLLSGIAGCSTHPPGDVRPCPSARSTAPTTSPASAPARSTCSSSAAASPAPAWPSTPPSRGPAHRPRRARRLRLGHVVEVVQAGPRRPALPPERRRPPRLRGPARAPAPAAQRPAPGEGAAVPHPDVHGQGRHHPQAGGPGARLGHVDVRPHRRPAHRQGPPAPQAPTRPSPTCRPSATAWPGPTSTTTPRPTTPASPSPLARTAALDHGAAVVNHAGGRRPAQGPATG